MAYIKIACIAGAPVDTMIGVDLLKKHGYEKNM